jgi:GTPase involved in cell partitioning and DNA repair
VWAVSDESLNSLTAFRKQLHYRAAPGASGGGSNRHGANGPDLEMLVSATSARLGLQHSVLPLHCVNEARCPGELLGSL